MRPIDNLTLFGTVTYTDAIFTQAIPSVGASDGNELPFTPTWAGSVRADYTWALPRDWNAHMGGGLRLVGDRFSSGPLLIDEFKSPGYAALDLNAAVDNGRYTIRLFVKNLTDTRAYLTEGALQNGLTGAITQVEGVVLQPRTVGLSFDVKL